VHIGTSGWSYKHWRGVFYPAHLKLSQWFPFYTQHFRNTEINTSFYRLPKQEIVKQWAAQAPANFFFCPKMSRFLTHIKRLREAEEPLTRFFGVFEHMGPRLGPVLIQLPPTLKFNAEVVEPFFQLLKAKYKNHAFAIEGRHISWLSEESISMLTRYEVGFVISHSANAFPYAEHITAPHIYMRFHGPAKLFASSYSKQQLRQYAIRIKQWMKEGHTIWAFFNNDIGGYAIKNALELQELLNREDNVP